MMPFLQSTFDGQKQLLIINQEDFIEFLQGPEEERKLALTLDDSHVFCLLHLLVQEDEDAETKEQPKFILYDEFVELVKTYMKKELIMK